MPVLDDYLVRILTARVYAPDGARETPLDLAPNLSQRLGNRLLLKREDLQGVFSFKIRGAYNKIALLPDDVRQRGVIAASAGNHAQGVATAARAFGCRAVIVMPARTPEIKVKAVRQLGGEVILAGESFQEAYEHAIALAPERGMTFIHPFDDPDVIAGQGTVAMEILRQHTGLLHAIFVCIGGGGLASGIAVYVKRLFPHVKVIGVEPTDAPSMHDSIAAGAPVSLPHVGMFADGVAVKRVGDETFRLCSELLDEVILVDTDAICAAIKDVFEDTRSILEPAGALGVAGAKAYCAREGIRDQTLVAVASGANMNFDRLRFVAERAEIGEAREAILAARIPERPGSFKAFCRLLGERNITEFNYRYHDDRQAMVFVGVSTANREETATLIRHLEANEVQTLDLSDNELAKLHIRHMVGGRNPSLANERLVAFEFPERPGALMHFLDALAPTWNISLFHYRNQGGDIGRVLAGIQVPDVDLDRFRQFLDSLHYPWQDATHDPACERFL